MSLKEKKQKFKQISDTLKELGIDAAILYTEDGVITFGDPGKILLTYLHCDKHFNEDVLPEIMDNVDGETASALIQALIQKN